MFRSCQMHVSVSQENFKQLIALVLKLLMSNLGKLIVRLFLVISLSFCFFLPQLYPFSEPEPPRF